MNTTLTLALVLTASACTDGPSSASDPSGGGKADDPTAGAPLSFDLTTPHTCVLVAAAWQSADKYMIGSPIVDDTPAHMPLARPLGDMFKLHVDSGNITGAGSFLLKINGRSGTLQLFTIYGQMTTLSTGADERQTSLTMQSPPEFGSGGISTMMMSRRAVTAGEVNVHIYELAHGAPTSSLDFVCKAVAP